ncbi:hypothetical protein NDI76_00390 [Halogeometricum sp. S1BR25-6]|uniref:DUF7835 domain-containing protein n=1 Tax=Halogeometricum salsisoli TaxID=2950536 RepID=A0ABU2G8R5_9EURY|nr:hypothetical protein [Halogeometricum sp. S1BR25-6]MDS0297198.1 hypothetical protein [Halogeometricum sp. S1BR25-6]
MTSRQSSDPSGVTESTLRHCENCGGRREHTVHLELHQCKTRDDVRVENKHYAKKPYRIATCVYCGESSREKII